ncbi:Quinol monooxygenase YgiN [Rubrimonas cliftonensis]|uniref:Quinol monooxygenase YgiN n=2 Tax=Rubrimonas cliftonensis TaxID=89524 RepID=A0A1H4E4L3_9RHOB|nr:Quinol monooxygenase YgiN [Rubrimonas cliftonensis]
MFCVTVEFTIDPGRRDAFLARMKRQADASLSLEPGCRVFEVWVEDARPDEVRLHEVYDDAAAFEAHLASVHFNSFAADIGPMVRERRLLTWSRRL